MARWFGIRNGIQPEKILTSRLLLLLSLLLSLFLLMWTVANFRSMMNMSKNRYTDVLCLDQSRVVLRSIGNDPSSDYINANFVDGYRQKNAYISTQGSMIIEYIIFSLLSPWRSGWMCVWVYVGGWVLACRITWKVRIWIKFSRFTA